MEYRRTHQPRFGIAAIAVVGIALLVVACDGVTSVDERPPVSFSLALHRAGLAVASTSARATDGRHELVFTNVQVTVGDVQLQRDDDGDVDDVDDGDVNDVDDGDAGDGDDGDVDDGDTEADDEDTEADDDDSDSDDPGTVPEVVATEAVVVELPVNGGTVSLATVPITEGRYEKIKLAVQRVRVRGSFDGQSFDLDVPVDGRAERRFRPSFVVASNGNRINITVSVRAVEWFRNRDGTLVDPRGVPADPTLVAQLRRSIIASLRAFEDSDRDGEEGGQG